MEKSLYNILINLIKYIPSRVYKNKTLFSVTYELVKDEVIIPPSNILKVFLQEESSGGILPILEKPMDTNFDVYSGFIELLDFFYINEFKLEEEIMHGIDSLDKLNEKIEEIEKTYKKLNK